MPSPHAPSAAPRRRKSPAFVVGLGVGWLLLAAWVALVAWNLAIAGPGAPLARLLALPALPGLPLTPALAAQIAVTLAALMLALLILLATLSLAPLRAVEAKPAAPPARAPEPVADPAPVRIPTSEQDAHRSPRPLGEGPGEGALATAANGAALPRRVFISHASGDNAYGYALKDWLQAQLGPGWVVWYDSHGGPDASGAWQDGIPPTSDWLEEIQREVMACSVFLVIETQAAMTSYWVQREIQMAWTRKPGGVEAGLVVVPVLRETCELPPLLALVQYVDYRPDGDEEQARRDLLFAVRSTRTRPAPLVEVGPPFDLSQLRPADRFIGREDDVAWVIERLTGPADSQVANVAATSGMGGIGKTALAAEAVRRLMAGLAFRDGVAVLDCRDRHGEADALALLRDLLARFTDGRRRADDADLAALGNLARTLLGGKRTLVLLDNVEADLPAGKLIAPLHEAGAAVLLTSRTPIDTLPVAASLRLDLLTEDDALALFADAYGRALSDAELAAARRIVRALGRHTLAVKLAAANAATRQRPLVPLALEFEGNPLRDAWLENSETAVAYVLETSVATMSPGAQRLFAALGAFATADVGRSAALALAQSLGDSENEAERSLRWIVDLRLADPAEIELPGGDADRERLRLHPLTQAWSSDLYAGHRSLSSAAPWNDAQRQAADRAIAAWYADYTNVAPDLALTPDEANIIGALDWALAHDDDRAAARICNGIRGFWRDTGRTRTGLRYLPLGAAAAGRIADETGERSDRLRQANLTVYLGDILQNTGRLDEAEVIFRQNLELRRTIEDRRGEGAVLSSLGQVALNRGRLDDAADYFQQALVIDRETQDRQGEGVDLSSLGQVALRRGRLDDAADYFQQSLPIRRETQNRQGEGVVLATLGQIAEARGQYGQAAQAYRDGIEALREVGDRINVAAILEALGAVLLQHSDDRAGGVAAFAEAIALWQEIGLADREQAAREEAMALGCDTKELPGEGNAAR